MHVSPTLAEDRLATPSTSHPLQQSTQNFGSSRKHHRPQGAFPCLQIDSLGRPRTGQETDYFGVCLDYQLEGEVFFRASPAKVRSLICSPISSSWPVNSW